MPSESFLHRLLTRGRRKAYAVQSRLMKNRIQSHTAALARAEHKFSAFPRVAVVFQTFNKNHMLPEVLAPFLAQGFQNIILFADGCCDNTIQTASRLLPGKNHVVLGTNNLHEIRTYALSSHVAQQLEVDYLLFCQDDDIYPADFGWLTAALELMQQDAKLATIGFNGGYDFMGPIADADENFSAAPYQSKNAGGLTVAKLPPYFAITGTALPFNRNGWRYDYVDLIDRAPQLLRLSFLGEMGGLPLQFAPYNYDDIFLCMTAWQRGFKVIHLPVHTIARNVGIGGMRLFKAMTTSKRPAHLGRNWHYLYAAFADFINGGELRKRVEEARSGG